MPLSTWLESTERRSWLRLPSLQTTHSSGARLPDGSYVSILAKLSLRVYQRRYSNGSRQGASPLRQHFPYFIAKKQPMDGYSIRSLKLGLFRPIGLIGKGFSPVATPPPSPLTESYCDLPSPNKLPQAVSFVYLRDLCVIFGSCRDSQEFLRRSLCPPPARVTGDCDADHIPAPIPRLDSPVVAVSGHGAPGGTSHACN